MNVLAKCSCSGHGHGCMAESSMFGLSTQQDMRPSPPYRRVSHILWLIICHSSPVVNSSEILEPFPHHIYIPMEKGQISDLDP